MSIFRKNTLIVDFSVLPRRPDAAKVQKFLEKDVQLQLSDATNIQLHNIRNCVFVEMINNETALRYQNQHNYKHVMQCDGKEFKIPVYVERESVTVRVHDLPPQMPLTAVVAHMQQYGTVISISRERWRHFFPGLHNGVLMLQVKLEQQIPSILSINGEATLVTYRNQTKTCRSCGRAAHPKQQYSKASGASNNNKSSETQDNPNANTCTIIATAAAATAPVPEPATEKASDTEIAQQNKNTENTTDDDSSSETDSAFTAAIVNQKRRLSRLKNNETKKVCVSQQGDQNAGDIIDKNRFEALVELDWMTPAELLKSVAKNKIRHKNGEKGGLI